MRPIHVKKTWKNVAVVLLTMAAVTTATATIYYNYVAAAATTAAAAAAATAATTSYEESDAFDDSAADRRDRDARGRIGPSRGRREEYVVCDTRHNHYQHRVSASRTPSPVESSFRIPEVS